MELFQFIYLFFCDICVGGNCKMEHWLKCNNLRTVTGDYYNKEMLEHFEMDCNDEKEFPWICMRNGWTVNRCHLLCMSGCHRGKKKISLISHYWFYNFSFKFSCNNYFCSCVTDILLTRNYENYVSHDGRCPPLSKKI